MAIKTLTKKYKLAWNNDLQIILNSENTDNIAISNANTFESDVQEDIQAKINELGLIETDI